MKTAPAREWSSNITYIRTRAGRFEYFTTVIDLFDSKVIGWSFSSGLEAAHTVIPALNMALCRRKFSARGLIFHSDRGVQYTSDEFVKLLKKNHLTRGNSRKGNCWDNAVVESFFKTLKAELVYGATPREPEQPQQQIFEWVEFWYNKRRQHVALENQSMDFGLNTIIIYIFHLFPAFCAGKSRYSNG